MNCFLSIWHKDTFIPVRLLEDYSNEAHLSAIAAAIEFLKTLQETESQLDHESSESEDDYGHVINPTEAKIVSNDSIQALPECPTIYWQSQMLNDSQLCFCFVHVPLIPNRGGKKRKYQFILIIGARAGA